MSQEFSDDILELAELNIASAEPGPTASHDKKKFDEKYKRCLAARGIKEFELNEELFSAIRYLERRGAEVTDKADKTKSKDRLQGLEERLGALTDSVDKLTRDVDELQKRPSAKTGGASKPVGSNLVANLVATVIALIAVLMITGITTWIFMKTLNVEAPSIEISFSIGETIGGALIGLAALLAGVSYANRKPNDG